MSNEPTKITKEMLIDGCESLKGKIQLHDIFKSQTESDCLKALEELKERAKKNKMTSIEFSDELRKLPAVVTMHEYPHSLAHDIRDAAIIAREYGVSLDSCLKFAAAILTFGEHAEDHKQYVFESLVELDRFRIEIESSSLGDQEHDDAKKWRDRLFKIQDANPHSEKQEIIKEFLGTMTPREEEKIKRIQRGATKPIEDTLYSVLRGRNRPNS